MKNIFILPIESIDTRYTAQWKTYIPKLLNEHIAANNLDYQVIDIDGIIEEGTNETTPGAFLNFAKTNIYKSSQAITVAKLFEQDLVKDGDQFIFTDAWNPIIIQLKYMAELFRKRIVIHGLWHAGSYDPMDWLGRHFNHAWSFPFEQSLFWAIDKNYFASDFHIRMFIYELFNVKGSGAKVDQMISRLHNKIVRCGWPMDYMPKILEKYKTEEKRNLILFPHRIAPEKQLDIFKDLAEALPEYEWIVCQEQNLTKDEYHKLLGESKIVFSANLQETLGISVYEGAIVGALPLMPDRLSYMEIWPPEFKYPSEWTESFDKYIEHKDKVIALIKQYIEEYDTYSSLLINLVPKITSKYFTADALINELFKSN